jgi:hypothetical protein
MIPRYIFYNSNNFTSSTKIRNGYTDYHQHSMKSLYISESLPYVSFNASIERHQATLYFYLTPCLRNCAILAACISTLRRSQRRYNKYNFWNYTGAHH